MPIRPLLALVVTLLSVVSAAGADPQPVLVVDVSAAAPEEHLLAASLQGLANRDREGPAVFLLSGPRDEEWLQFCLRLSPRPVQMAAVEDLLERLKPGLAGQIIYDPRQPYTVNIATTAAGVRGAVASPADLGLPTLFDLRNRWSSEAEAYAWAEASLLAECSRTTAALLPAEAVHLRDYAIQQRMFVFSAPTDPQDPTFQDILHHLPPGTALYGEAPDMLRGAISGASHFIVSAGQAGNLSFLSQLETAGPFHQYVGYLEPNAPRYLTLIFDCSDVDVALNDMPTLWDRSQRGLTPLGWALPAALARAAPPVLRRYYADAYRSGIDGFMLGPSGAGEMDLPASTAPYAFLEATAKAVATLGAHTMLYAPPGVATDVGETISRLVADTGIRGIFVLAPPDFPPLLHGRTPVLAAPRVDSVADAVSYLDRIPLDRRFAALCLNPRLLTPADATHIASHVARRFVVVPPEELTELMRNAALGSGEAAAAVASVDYPAHADPTLPIPLKAVIEAPEGLDAAGVVYRPVANPVGFYAAMRPGDDAYHAEIPPIRCGGELALSVRTVDRAGRASWSPPWTIDIPRADADADGLSDAEEAYLLTDSEVADTDGDGLRDSGDLTPVQADEVIADYLGPIRAPSDAPYVFDAGESTVAAEGRRLRPGQECIYWLPLSRRPAAAPAVVGMDALGPAAIAVAGDPALFVDGFSGDLAGAWYSAPLPVELPGGVFVRLACPAGASGDLLVRGVGVFSPPGAPSLGDVAFAPGHPGPRQRTVVSATIFSPKGVARASLTYRVNGGGEITIPMSAVGESQRYQAAIPALENRDELEWWISAVDREGAEAASAPRFVPIGARGRETVSLVSRRDFLGDWSPSADWEGAGRQAGKPGVRDSAAANLTGGTYTVWVFGGGRGQGIGIYVDHNRVGAIDPDRPDGWQPVGRIRLDAGRYHVHVVSEAVRAGPAEAKPRYAAVILSADPAFRPSADQVIDIYNVLVLESPRPGDVLSGHVELRATGAGNLSAVEFLLDNQLLRRVSGPPFDLFVNTGRLPNGPHVLKVQAIDRAGSSGLNLEVPVTVAN